MTLSRQNAVLSQAINVSDNAIGDTIFIPSGNVVNLSGILTATSGNFINSLQLNGTGVSVSGHAHTSSDIINFNSSVSGLLPTISNSGDNRVLTSTGSSVGINAENNLTFNGSLLNVTGSGYFASGVTMSGYLNVQSLLANTIAGIDSLKNISGLSTTFWPDLFELMHVKGVTSSIQTQLNGKQATLTNPVTGTGIVNHIPYWSSTSGLLADSNELIWDASNNRLGIGTTTPSSQLHVIGSGIFSSGLFINSTPVSVSGHSHTSSDITNFNSSVSGLINGIYAPLNSPALIGVPTVPTASSGTNTTQIASTAFVRTEISNLVASAPTVLDTLNELATALGNDANFSTTVTNNLAGKANLSGATFTGSISGPSGDFTSLKSNGTDVSVVGHTHTISNINGLQTALDNKQPSGNYALSSHTHTSSNITDFNSSVSGLLTPYQLALTNPVTGVGTNGYLTKWISGSGVSSGIIFDDGTNIGIGTISPIVKLEVAGDTYANNILSTGYLVTNYILAINDFDGGSPGIINIGEFTSLNQLYWTIDQNGSGNFSVLSVNDTPVSLNGHTHSSSDITNFNSSVSGLLPTISNSGDNRVLTSTGSSVGINAENNLTFNSSLLNVTGSGSFSNNVTASGFIRTGGTSSQFLKADGSVDSTSYQSSLTNPVTGTGIASHIAYWNSSSGIVADSGQLYWDSTNNRLGIGTTTPSGQLHVVGTGLFSSGLGINTTNFNFFDIYDNIRNATVSVSGDVFIQNALYFYNPSEVDNRRRGLISSDGDAILNTLGVGEKADTLGNSVVMNTNGLVVNNALGLGGSACQLLGDYGAIIENTLIVNSNSNGNATVGIGTSTPSETLDVAGNINVNGSIKHTVNAGDFNDNIAPITWYNIFNDVNSVIAKIDISTDTSPIEGMLVFHTSDGSGLQERVRITDVGNVGIGTATPEYKLQVSGSFGATTKSFRIDHPSKKGYSLEYGSLESPYHGVRLTGRGKVIKGVGTVDLPDYLKDLIHDDESIVVQLTNYKHRKTLYVDMIDLQNDRFFVKSDRAKTLGELEFFWTLTGTRKDVEDLVVEKEN